MILQIYGSYGNDTTQRAPRRSVTVSERSRLVDTCQQRRQDGKEQTEESPHSYMPFHMLQHELPDSFMVASDRTSSTRSAFGLPTPLLIKLQFPEGGLNYGIP